MKSPDCVSNVIVKVLVTAVRDVILTPFNSSLSVLESVLTIRACEVAEMSSNRKVLPAGGTAAWPLEKAVPLGKKTVQGGVVQERILRVVVVPAGDACDSTNPPIDVDRVVVPSEMANVNVSSGPGRNHRDHEQEQNCCGKPFHIVVLPGWIAFFVYGATVVLDRVN